MYRILLAIDSNEQRAKQAAEAVVDIPRDPEDVDVLILNVFEDFEYRDDSVIKSEDMFEGSEPPESVSIATEILKEAEITISTRREHGDPTEQIVSVAEEIDADMIALSGRKRSPTGKVLFGSVTQSVLLAANRPVHIVIGN